MKEEHILVRPLLPASLNVLNNPSEFEETSQNVHPDPSGGAGVLPGPPGDLGVTNPPDEHISSQENSLNSETLHSETGIDILPEDQKQQKLLNEDPPSIFLTENALPGVKDEVDVAPLPEERESLGASRDASTNLLGGIPSTNVQVRDFFSVYAPCHRFHLIYSHPQYYRRKYHC